MTQLRTQSQLASFIEAVSNTVIGFFISVSAQWALFHLYGIKATMSQFIWLSIWMTVLSVVRSYVLRRMWNAEWWTKFKRTHPDKVQADPHALMGEYLPPLQDVDSAHAKRWLTGDWENTPHPLHDPNDPYCNCLSCH